MAKNTNNLVSDVPHPAVKAFADVLEAIAQSAEEIQEQDAEDILNESRQWVAHLLEGGAPPRGESKEAPQWDGARDFAVQLIRREKDFVVTRIDDFRQMIWVVIQGLRDAFRDEQSMDHEVVLHLDRLREAADSDSIDELRREVVAAVVLIGRAIEDRKKRQRAQLEDLGSQLNKMRAELLKAQKEMALDPMTRLYNRASLGQLLKKTIELSLLSGQSACLCLIDVDYFKHINDTYGHISGDRALVAIANCLKKTFPRKTDFVARYGGDEFVVVLQDTRLNDGQMLAKRLLAAIKGLDVFAENGEKLGLSLSIGVAEIKKSDDPKAWLAHADQALYQAKRAGRGCVWAAR